MGNSKSQDKRLPAVRIEKAGREVPPANYNPPPDPKPQPTGDTKK